MLLKSLASLLKGKVKKQKRFQPVDPDYATKDEAEFKREVERHTIQQKGRKIEK